ncbi:MAG TPA: hypothetical protein VGS11_02335 [Candidatus Bathyarchaeia archaeon]|nr:hypothetical protein [Candidatus Bathyarchaeia archaeon]
MLTPRYETDYLAIRQCPKCGSMNRHENGVCAICGATLPELLADMRQQYGEDPLFPQIVDELSTKLGLEDHPSEAFYKPTYWIFKRSKLVQVTHDQEMWVPSRNSFQVSATELPVDPSYPEIIGKTMLISPLLGGRLQVEEWRPILAAPLIFYKKLKGARSRGLAWRLALIILTPILLLQLTSSLPLNSSQPIIQAALIGGGLCFFALLAISYSFFRRRMILRADSMVAKLLGRESLLAALNKLESLREHDKQANIGWPSRSITKRIEYLNAHF